LLSLIAARSTSLQRRDLGRARGAPGKVPVNRPVARYHRAPPWYGGGRQREARASRLGTALASGLTVDSPPPVQTADNWGQVLGMFGSASWRVRCPQLRSVAARDDEASSHDGLVPFPLDGSGA
jgi:hypothetical protein